MIDLTKIVHILENKKCKTHTEKPTIKILNKEAINIKTCCEEFKKELETTYKSEITKQTQEAIKKLFK
jgi:hypothetical protein